MDGWYRQGSPNSKGWWGLFAGFVILLACIIFFKFITRSSKEEVQEIKNRDTNRIY